MRKLLIIILAVLSLSLCVHAGTPESARQELQKSVPSQAQPYMEGIGPEDSFSGGIHQILHNAASLLSSPLKKALKNVSILLCALILASLGASNGAMNPSVIAGALSIAGCAMTEMNVLTQSGQQTLTQLQAFADLLLPAMAASTAAVGGVSASAAIYAGTAVFTNVLMKAMTEVLIPLIYCYIALCAAQTVCGNELLSRLANLIRWIFQTGLKAMLFVFTTYLTVTGLISGSTDAAIMKATKLTLSGVVPVVGSMISDASETVIAGAIAVRSSVGIFGMLAVIAICVGPFLHIGMQFLLMKLAGAVGGALGPKPLLNLMDGVTQAFGFLLAVTGSAALMLLVSCVCYLKVSPI